MDTALQNIRIQVGWVGFFVTLGVLIGLWYFTTDKVQPEFVQATPYIITLLVLSVASQRLRPPAAEGRPWRKGQVD